MARLREPDLLPLNERKPRFTPANCPHCEYDRRFPESKSGGWMYMGNGAPLTCCPVCNPDGKHPRS
jgi:hypothetical protein